MRFLALLALLPVACGGNLSGPGGASCGELAGPAVVTVADLGPVTSDSMGAPVVAGEYVYLKTAHAISRAPRRGGRLEVLVRDGVTESTAFTSDGAYLYYYSITDGLHERPVAGGADRLLPFVPALGPYGDLVMAGSRRLLVGQGDLATVEEIWAWDGERMTRVVGSSESPLVYGFRADSTDVYWLTRNDRGPSMIMATPLGGGRSRLVATNPGVGIRYQSQLIGLDDANLYLQTNSGDGLWRVPKAGGDAIAMLQSKSDLLAWGGAVSDGHVYYSQDPYDALMRVSTSGGAPEVFAHPGFGGMHNFWGVTTDECALYWVADDGARLSLLRKGL